jgi:hypothetical protein
MARDRTKPRRRPIRRIERALIGGVMAVIAFVVERLVVRSLKRSGPDKARGTDKAAGSEKAAGSGDADRAEREADPAK